MLRTNTLSSTLPSSAVHAHACTSCDDVKWINSNGIAIPCPDCLQKEIDDKKLKRAKIKSHYMKFDFNSYPADGDPRLLKCANNWTLNGDNYSLLLMGSIGAGKTTLACCALKYRIVVNNKEGLFMSALDLLEKARAGFSDHTTSDFIEHVKNVDVLVLDDLGNVDSELKGWKDEIFQSIIAHRHDEELQTIYTTNLDFEQLCNHIGVRASSRIKESTGGIWWYETSGRNLRP